MTTRSVRVLSSGLSEGERTIRELRAPRASGNYIGSSTITAESRHRAARPSVPSSDGGRHGRVRQAHVLKEEEFLEEYLGTVEAVVDLLHLDWQPNYSCTDSARDEFARTAGRDSPRFASTALIHTLHSDPHSLRRGTVGG